MASPPDPTPIVVIMGVTGSGKSTLAALLAARTGGTFLDADDFHPPENIAKMRRGLPLDDADRAGWLATLAAILHSHPPSAPPLFLACSALKHAYRDSLQAANPARISFAFLNAPPELIRNRLQQRHTAGSHFMPPALLDSQLATLEPPTGAITLDASLPPALLADQLLAKLTIPY